MLRFDWGAVAAVWPCWCRALLLYRDVEKNQDAKRSRTTLGWFLGIRTRVPLGAVGAFLENALAKQGSFFPTVAPNRQGEKKKPAFG